MKKNDIKAGVLYGYAQGTSEYRRAKPIIVLDASGLWTWSRGYSKASRTTWHVSNATRFTANQSNRTWGSYRNGDDGYLVLHGSTYRDPQEQAAHLAQLQELFQEFKATPGNPDAVKALDAKVEELEGITLEVVNNRWITGDYLAAKEEEQQREEDRMQRRGQEERHRKAVYAFIEEAREEITRRIGRSSSVTRSYEGSQDDVLISFGDLAALLEIDPPHKRVQSS